MLQHLRIGNIASNMIVMKTGSFDIIQLFGLRGELRTVLLVRPEVYSERGIGEIAFPI